jgi:D-tagatose-1,6-bisphosphate aldolase subunit GatZ/KbaZ
MNKTLRERAASAGMPLMDYILKRISELESQSGIKRSIFAACPNSISVIRAALKSAKRCNSPIKFAATLNQVDADGGYTGLTPSEFVRTIRLHARNLNVTSPVIIAIDHGGPWLKDVHKKEKWRYSKTLAAVKESFELAIAAGYDLIHVDPTVDITLQAGENISIDLVAERTLELIVHTENFRRKIPLFPTKLALKKCMEGWPILEFFGVFWIYLRRGWPAKVWRMSGLVSLLEK